MELFNINQEGTIDYAPEALAIPEFKVLYDRDNKIGKPQAWIDLTAAFFIASVSTKNPYKGYTKEERIDLVGSEILSIEGFSLNKDKELTGAIARIIEIEEKSLMKGLLRTGIKHIGKLRQFLDEADLFEEDAAGKLKHDVTKHQAVIERMTATAKNIKMLQDEVKKEEEGEDVRIRGGGEDEFDV